MKDSKSPATKADIENLISLFNEAHETTQRGIGQVEESTQEQFLNIDKRMDDLGGRMSGLDSRMDGMDERLVGLDSRMDGMDGRLSDLNTRMDVTDQRFGGLSSLLKSHIAESNRRFDALNEYADRILSNVCNISDKLLTNHEHRLQRLEKQLGVVA